MMLNHVVMMDSSANWAMLNDTTVLDGFTVSGGAGLSNSSISINGFDMYDDDGAGIYAFGGHQPYKN